MTRAGKYHTIHYTSRIFFAVSAFCYILHVLSTTLLVTGLEFKGRRKKIMISPVPFPAPEFRSAFQGLALWAKVHYAGLGQFDSRARPFLSECAIYFGTIRSLATTYCFFPKSIPTMKEPAAPTRRLGPKVTGPMTPV